MSKGRVLEYFPQRGWGSIIDAVTGHKLIVYANYLHLLNGGILNKGQEVEYDIEKHGSEDWAMNVKSCSEEGDENQNGHV